MNIGNPILTLFLGLLLPCIGYVARILYEKIKFRFALQNEFAKQRLVHVAEVWKAVYRWDFVVESLCREFVQDEPDQEKIHTLTINSENLMEKAMNIVEDNRFWLSRDYYTIIDFQNANVERIEAIYNNDLMGLKKASKKHKNSMQSLKDYP